MIRVRFASGMDRRLDPDAPCKDIFYPILDSLAIPPGVVPLDAQQHLEPNQGVPLN